MTDVNRRRFLAGAAVTGLAAWTVPTITTINVAAAASQAGSAQPKPPTEPPETVPPKPPRKAVVPAEPREPDGPGGNLPYTGDAEGGEALLAVGLVGMGVALSAYYRTDPRSI